MRAPDPLLAAVTLGLAAGGVVLAGSARVFLDATATGTPVGLVRSLGHLGIGLLAMTLLVMVDYRRLADRRLVWLLFFGIVALLLTALALPPVANTHRFIRFGGVGVQPSELAKPALVLLLSAALVRAGDELRTWRGLSRPLILGGTIAGLVLVGRDLGTPILMFGLTLALVVAAGARWLHVAQLLGVGAVLFAGSVLVEPYRMRRLAGYREGLLFDPERLMEVPYQLRQSYLALGSGGIAGEGLGSSTLKAFFLPEPDNDFLFAIIGEETGLIGTFAVLGAFLVIAWRGLVIAERAPDPLGRLIALGASWMLVGQALCHMGVVTGLLPTKGLSLPFLSTGGSGLIAALSLAGLILGVSLRSHGRLVEVRRG
jgi:cell division protein FtsW